MQNREMKYGPKYLNVTKEKSYGIVYTPDWIVNLILDSIGYIDSLEQKTIIDPACGSGNFLTLVLDRLLNYLEEKDFSHQDKINIIGKNIYGFDTDEDALKKCKFNLHNVLLKHNISDRVDFNLFKRNALDRDLNSDLFNKFDFVTGNPPYVRIQNLDKTTRSYIQENYSFCSSGSTDIYIAFFQLGTKLLNESGILGFITPNTYFYSDTAKLFREYLKRSENLKEIIDFNEKQIFEGITTYSAITVINKNGKSGYFKYYTFEEELKFIDNIPFSLLNENKWVLGSVNVLNRIRELENRGRKLGEIAEIHAGLATLADNYYIFKDVLFHENTATVRLNKSKEYTIEKEILKPIVKVSILKSSNEIQNRFVIFPYKLVDQKYIPISEEEMRDRYPLTYEYFLSVRERLKLRDKGKTITPWYAFGRTQGLNSSFGKKILVSPLSNNPRFIVWDKPEYTFYAGYCIKYDGNLDSLAKQLNSEDMKFYIEHSSRIYRGGYRSYSKSFIKNFGVDLQLR
ncbi:HsdM family class I SAM-dependent methyltransferase [Cuniculiplasma sp. SKW4]|uniref:HsdM family class I SAM-dependent methyltransferase n=1 Tax=Cuniculiplasma sp. SKW4 TaxID=3400171 RepID=UPI003FCF4416